MKTGIQLIAEERKEQIKKHKWTSKHDDIHILGELAEAAVVCASNIKLYWRKDHTDGCSFNLLQMPNWNLPVKYNGNVLIPNYNSTTDERIHQLKVAGALIAAEIDRLLRKGKNEQRMDK